MSLWYVIPILHAAACLALAAAAVHRKLRQPVPEGAHRILFPYILTAGLTGCMLVVFWGWEAFVAWYGGAIFTVTFEIFGITPHWLVAISLLSLIVLLPGFGLVPVVGKRPVLMAILALVALLPSIGMLMVE